MKIEIPQWLSNEIASWHDLSPVERAALGKALRNLGMSYGEIMAVIPVPKSTLAYWCRDIALTGQQQRAIEVRSASRRGRHRDTQRRRRLEIGRIRDAARGEVPRLICEPKWVAGTVLYWAEGSKTKRSLEMVNSDPEVLRIFIAWIRSFIEPLPQFSLMLHLHDGNDEAQAQAHWTAELDLPDANWHKTFVKPPGTGHRKNHLAHGVCRVRMRRSTDAFVRTLAWIEALHGRLR